MSTVREWITQLEGIAEVHGDDTEVIFANSSADHIETEPDVLIQRGARLLEYYSDHGMILEESATYVVVELN